MIAALTASVVVSTLGWFTATEVTDLRIDSGVISSYFEPVGDSDGSQAHPWVIARPVHLFNLMYLQQSEKMVKDPDNPTGDDVKYCQAHYWYQFGKEVSSGVYKFVDYGDDGIIAAGYGSDETYSPYLNMTYYSNEKALIPIGSEAFPFVGHIVGNNLTVKNMTIYSNHQSDVGVFGYVAQGATVSNAYFDNVTINIQGFNSPREANVAPHPIHADSGTKDTYICSGYLAGHVYDADASFSDVYINNCKMDNEPIATPIKNNFGYFGKVDLNDATPVGADKHYSLHPNEVHNYFENNYSSVKDMNLASRNSEYAGSGGSISGNPLVSSGVSKGSYTDDDVDYNSYKFNDINVSGTKHTSLATSGYRTDEKELYDAVYYDSDAKEDHSFNPGTIILNDIPEDPESMEDGTYLYYDYEDNEPSWAYLSVSSEPGETKVINFNCYTISYVNNGTTYYLKYDNGSIIGTTTTPDHVDQEAFADYYFAFKDNATSKGVTSISDAAASLEYKIFIPNHDCYINASASGTTSSLTTTSTFSSALGFKVRGNSTEIYCASADSYKLWCSGPTVILRNCVAGVLGQTFSIRGSETQTEQTYTSTYDVVSNVSELHANDVVSFVYNDSGTYYMIGSQAKNNRNGVVVNVTDGHISDVAGLAIANFKLGQTSNGWTFQDEDTNQYLYAAGTKTSGSNYLRSQDSITSNGWAEWDSISINGTTATIHNYGNHNVEYLNYHTGTSNEGTYHIFRCSHSSSGSPMVFKRSSTSGGEVHYEKSFIYSAISQSSGEKTYDIYYTYYGDVGSTEHDYLLTDANAQFNVMASQVMLQASAGGWNLVKDASTLRAGDTIVLASNANGKTAGDISSSIMGVIDTTFTNDKSGIVELGTGTVQMTLGGSSGAWTFSNGSNLLGATDAKKLAWGNGTTTWSISINSNGDATIQNGASSYGRFLYNVTSPRFTTYTSSASASMLLPQIYKFTGASTAKSFYFGDQVGGSYDPHYIDTVGQVTYKHDSAQFDNTSTTYNAITASNSLSFGSKFYATQHCGNSTVLYIQNNKSRDLGNITFAYTGADAKFTKGGGNGITFADAGCIDLDPTGGYKYQMFLSATNIDQLAYCGLDANGNIYSKYDSGNPIVSSGTYDYYSVETFVIVISSSGTTNVSDVEYNFTALPGNTGNFGEVGYRSAHYNSNGVFDGNNPQHTLDGTIVNFYYEVGVNIRSSIAVSFDYVTSIYDVTLLSTANFNVYIFNYDIMVYTVRANNVAMKSSSETYNVPITPYDPETGWQI